jgi:hypothetical protein
MKIDISLNRPGDIESLSQSTAWWDSLTAAQQRIYLAKHPKSKFAQTAKEKMKVPKGVSTKIRQRANQLLLDSDTEPLTRKRLPIIRTLNDSMPVRTKANIASFYNALEGDKTSFAKRTDSKSLGLMLSKLGERDRSPSIYRDTLTRMFRPKDPKTFSSFFGASMSMSKLALGAAIGVAAATNPLVAATLAAYFVNALLDGGDDYKPKKVRPRTSYDDKEKSNLNRVGFSRLQTKPDEDHDSFDDGVDDDFESESSSVDPVTRLVDDYISFWSTIDHGTLYDKISRSGYDTNSVSLSAAIEAPVPADIQASDEDEAKRLRMTLRTCPTQHGIPKEHKRRFLLCVNGDVRGFLSWDKAMGDPDKSKFGWVVTLYHGFNENAYRSGRNPKNPMEPFTAIHNGELKLHNPCRMPLALARSWARQALRR